MSDDPNKTPPAEGGGSYRQILRSSSIIGGASVINILIGLGRTKVAALLLGPAGLGLIGLLQSLMGTASTVAALGLGTIGTRQIAEAVGQEDAEAVGRSRRALFWGTLGLSVLGGSTFWLLRGVLAEQILGDPEMSSEVGWLTLGVSLTVAAGSQSALLKGLRRVGDIARVSIFSSVVSTALGVGALLLWGRDGILAFVLTVPLASFVLGHVYVARLPRVQAPPTRLSQLVRQWRVLARLGVAFTLAGLVGTVGQLALRTLIQHDLGAESLGYFQAAWKISMTYVGFVLQAMGLDYYPRLTAIIADHEGARRLVNEQAEVALLLAGPVFLVALGLAPWVITVLYSAEFDAAVSVLRWQILGDLLKVASFPLAFVILAAGHGRTFVATESLAVVLLLGVSWLTLPLVGIEGTGIAFLSMYAVYLPIVYGLARRSIGFRWDPDTLRDLAVLFTVASAVSALSAWSAWGGGVAGVSASLVFGVYSVRRLSRMAGLTGVLSRIASLGRRRKPR